MNRFYVYIVSFIIFMIVAQDVVAANASSRSAGEILSKSSSAQLGGQLQQNKKESISIPLVPAPVFADDKREKRKKENTGPQQSKNLVDQEMLKAEYEKYLNAQISQLEKMSSKTLSKTAKGEILLRLAEAYVEKAKVIDFKKQNEYDEKLKLYQQGKLLSAPKLETAEADVYSKKAVNLYEQFVREYPKDEKIPQAYFFLGLSYFEMSQNNKAVETYETLVKKHPNSPLAPEGYFALGDYYFENGQFEKAFANYRETLKDKGGRLYTFALYKSAWSLFRLGKYEEALRAMEIFIRQAQIESENNRKADRQKLYKEASRDYVMFYVEGGDPNNSANHFKKIFGDEYLPLFDRLGYQYVDKGNKEASRKVFKELISLNPTNPKNFDYQYQIVLQLMNQKDVTSFKQEMFYWVENFGINSAWYNANQTNSEVIQSSQKLMESFLRTWTLQQHQIAQTSRAPLSQSLATEGYSMYFKQFPKHEQTADMHFYYGELLFDMQKFSQASEQYKWVTENQPTHKLAEKGAENVVISLERAIPADQVLASRVANTTNPIKLDPAAEVFIQHVDWYVLKYPNSNKVIDLRFRVGRLYYQHNQFDLAISTFKDIINKNPNSKYAEYSANLILDIYNLRKDYSGIEEVGAELLKVPALANTKAGQDIREIIAKAGFKKAQDLEVAKDYLKSAQMFESYAKINNKTQLGNVALFNAALNYERAGMLSQGVAIHKTILNSGDSGMLTYKPKSRRILAKYYQDTGQLELAAEYYEVAARDSAKDPAQSGLYYNSAVLYEACANWDKAVENYSKYISIETKPEKNEAFFTIAELSRKDDKWKAAIDGYQAYIANGARDKSKIAQSFYYLFEAYGATGNSAAQMDARKKIIAFYQKNAPIGSSYVAKIKLLDVEKKLDILKSIKIPSDERAQAQAAQKKLTLLSEITRDLTEIVKIDSANEIIGALALLGESNEHMYNAFLNAPMPASVPIDQMDQFKEQAKTVAMPFMQKAQEAYKAGNSRALELEVVGPFVDRIRASGSRLNLNLTPIVGEKILRTEALGSLGL